MSQCDWCGNEIKPGKDVWTNESSPGSKYCCQMHAVRAQKSGYRNSNSDSDEKNKCSSGGSDEKNKSSSGCGGVIGAVVIIGVVIYFWFGSGSSSDGNSANNNNSTVTKNTTVDNNNNKDRNNNKNDGSAVYGNSIEYGGQTYKTTKIGDLLWMTQNLNYEPSNGNSWCNNTNCNKYGRLYDWKTAMSVCPVGYHLPTQQEWNNLVAAAGGKDAAGRKLKAISGWNENGGGTDEFGFSALPAGGRHSEGVFNDVGNNGRWWTATGFGDGGSLAYYRSMYYNNDRVGEDYYGKSRGYSVRCVK